MIKPERKIPVGWTIIGATLVSAVLWYALAILIAAVKP